MKDKKAQLAVETLMIYGVVILIVMIAIGALIRLDVFDVGALFPDKCEITGVNIICDDYVVSEDEVKLSIQNSMGENINIYGIFIEGEDDMTGVWSDSEETPCSFVDEGGLLLVNGAKETFELDECNIKIPPGNKIKGTLMLNYSRAGSEDFIKKAYGTIDVKVS